MLAANGLASVGHASVGHVSAGVSTGTVLPLVSRRHVDLMRIAGSGCCLRSQ
jgi:hypothetical protein